MPESLGMRIKLARTRQGLNQTQLAKTLGIPKQVISLIECGKTKPGFDRIQKIAEALDTSLDYLSGRTEQYRLHKEPTLVEN